MITLYLHKKGGSILKIKLFRRDCPPSRWLSQFGGVEGRPSCTLLSCVSMLPLDLRALVRCIGVTPIWCCIEQITLDYTLYL